MSQKNINPKQVKIHVNTSLYYNDHYGSSPYRMPVDEYYYLNYVISNGYTDKQLLQQILDSDTALVITPDFIQKLISKENPFKLQDYQYEQVLQSMFS